jgi:dipeptidyl aminopeptidase/acylaminoacyl peptidase
LIPSTARSSGAARTVLIAFTSLAAGLLVPAAPTARGALSAQAPFSVHDVMSFSFASGLVASPTGNRVAWIENHEGERNIWMATGPAWSGRPVTSYRGDDGQELASLAFTPDGDRLLFVRGGAPNRAGEVPDPQSTPDEEERAIWVVSAHGGEPRRVMEGGSVSLAPDGSRIAYSNGRDIFVRSLDQDAEARRVARVRGSPGALTWSPDGTRLAFVSGRGDHAFIGVLDPDAGSVSYLDPSVANDGSPTWSPDGRRIAFLRVPNERVVHMFAPRREALPFSIRVADVSTGEAREVWRASPGPGSVFSGIEADSQLFWADGDRVVFPWEGDGWKHLYALPLTGGTPTLLTPGAAEVQFASISPDRRSVIYDSNEGDIDRKHVWRVSVTGGAPELLTPGEGIEWGAVVTSGGAVAFHAASATEPAHTEVLVGGTRSRTGPDLPDSFPVARMVEPEQVVFRAADGMAIHGQLFIPPNATPGTRNPGVLFFHGGSRRQMLLGFHHRGYYHNSYAMNQLLANAGYVVLSVNYRSGIGYGMEFREAENYGAAGASEFADVLGGGLYLQSRGDVDPDRIGLWGGSYGGYLTALGLARASDLFAAGVDIHGVHDWNVVINGFRPSYEPEDHPEFSRLAFGSSPMAFLDGWRSPVLIIHGDDDRNVPFSESVDLAEALARRGVDFEQLVFPDEVHGFLLHRNWVAAFAATLDFFERRLKKPTAELP